MRREIEKGHGKRGRCRERCRMHAYLGVCNRRAQMLSQPHERTYWYVATTDMVMDHGRHREVRRVAAVAAVAVLRPDAGAGLWLAGMWRG